MAGDAFVKLADLVNQAQHGRLVRSNKARIDSGPAIGKVVGQCQRAVELLGQQVDPVGATRGRVAWVVGISNWIRRRWLATVDIETSLRVRVAARSVSIFLCCY